METTPEKKSWLARASILCFFLTLPLFAVFMVFLYFENLVWTHGTQLNNELLDWLGLIGMTGTFLLLIVTLALGVLAYWQNYLGLRTVAGKAAAKRGIEFGIIGIILSLILCVFLPKGFRSRIPFNEDSAIRSLRTIHTVAYAYAKAHPERGFPAALKDLPVSQHYSNDYNAVDAALAGGYKNGYSFTYMPRSTHNNGKLDAYDVIAEPIVPQTTGNRYFFSDETDAISVSLSRDPAGKKPLSRNFLLQYSGRSPF